MNIDEYIQNNRLQIIVKPNSPKNEIINWDENKQALRINIKEKAEDNKANIAIIKFFSRLTKKNVRIVSGFKSKQKIIEITDLIS
ncbi:YggU family protein [Candidatus Woesearchaeota archaeon]|nr:YggU family protein [Candidatus Woesearchaeota archaeon]